MKNGQTANPLNKFAKASKEVSSKRKKTDADYEELMRLDFLGALYMNANGPCIPGRCMEAAIVAGAKKEKAGMDAKAGMICEGSFDLKYNGPRTADELFAAEEFRDVQPVKIGGKVKVMRCRPIFQDWTADIIVKFDDALCNPAQVERWVRAAGLQCGVGDYRPKHGRFTAVVIQPKTTKSKKPQRELVEA